MKVAFRPYLFRGGEKKLPYHCALVYKKSLYFSSKARLAQPHELASCVVEHMDVIVVVKLCQLSRAAAAAAAESDEAAREPNAKFKAEKS